MQSCSSTPGRDKANRPIEVDTSQNGRTPLSQLLGKMEIPYALVSIAVAIEWWIMDTLLFTPFCADVDIRS